MKKKNLDVDIYIDADENKRLKQKKEPMHKKDKSDESFRKEMKPDRLKKKDMPKKGMTNKDAVNKKKPESKKFKSKVSKVMKEYKEDKLHSGSKKGPVVRKPKQAIAIAMSEAKKAVKKKKKKVISKKNKY